MSVGTCFGKFTKTNKFRLHITALDFLAPYAKVTMGDLFLSWMLPPQQAGVSWKVSFEVLYMTSWQSPPTYWFIATYASAVWNMPCVAQHYNWPGLSQYLISMFFCNTYYICFSYVSLSGNNYTQKWKCWALERVYNQKFTEKKKQLHLVKRQYSVWQHPCLMYCSPLYGHADI